MDRRTRRIEETKAEIRRAAARLFFEKGYRAVTMAEIGADVGLSPGALYYYFDSKESILREIEAECLGSASDLPNRLRDASDDLMGSILTFFEAVYRFAIERREYFLFLTRLVSSVDHGLVQEIWQNRFTLYREIHKILTELLRDFQQEGRARADLPAEDLDQFLMGLVHSLMFAWFLGLIDDGQMESKIRSVARLFVDGATKKEQPGDV